MEPKDVKQEEQETPQKHRLWREFIPALALTLAISFLLCLYGPLELYFTNTGEFHFDLYALLPVVLGLFGLCFVAGLAVFGLCRLIYRPFYELALSLGPWAISAPMCRECS